MTDPVEMMIDPVEDIMTALAEARRYLTAVPAAARSAVRERVASAIRDEGKREEAKGRLPRGQRPEEPSDDVAQLRAVGRALAAHLDPEQPRPRGRPCGEELLTCADTYVAAVLKRVDAGEALGREELLALDAAARGDTAGVPSWQLRQFLRRQGVPDAFVVRNVHAAGEPGSGVVARPDRQTTRLPSQVSVEDPWRAERKRTRRAVDATRRGETIRVRGQDGQMETITKAAHLVRRWEAEQ
jgi:hypothetical protein